MARLKKEMPCGCIVGIDYDDNVIIVYCKKHEEKTGWKSPEEFKVIVDLKDRAEAIVDTLDERLHDAREAALREATTVYDRYIALLVDELNEVVPLATVHGWKSQRFEQGKECRDAITALKAKYLPEAKGK